MSFTRALNNFLANPAWRWTSGVVAVIAIVLATWANLDTRNRAACQAQYNETNNARTRAIYDDAVNLDQAEAASDAAMAAFVRSLIDGTGQVVDPQTKKPKADSLFRTFDLALARQSQARDTLTETRVKNPIPPAPNALCS